MMRKLFIFASALFWVAIFTTWAASSRAPGTPAESAAAADRRIGLDEVARHAVADDCWMVINGVVYDITSYLPEHPSNPRIVVPWCGREASDAYRTKTRGRAHSVEADALLNNYRIGVAGAATR